MENQNITQEQEEIWKNWEKSSRRGKIAGGIAAVIFGTIYLAKELGADIPGWLLSWKMLLIVIGLVVGFKSMFRHPSWIVFIAIGSAFVISDYYPQLNFRPFIWPVIIIVVGLIMIFKPRRRFNARKWERWHNYSRGNDAYKWRNDNKGNDWHCEKKSFTTSEGYIESTSIMGSVKKNVISKDFKGGEIVNIFGGAEYDLSQADIVESATLEITQVFGGTKLIIPSHWEIKSENSVAVFGGIEDKRPAQLNITNTTHKTLILRGETIFGGIEIRS